MINLQNECQKKKKKNLDSLEKHILLTMLTILDIIELEPVEHASILKGPS